MAFCSVIGVTILGLFGDRVGRRWSFILFSIPTVIGWILAYFSRGFITLLLSRILNGTAAGAFSILSMIGAAEYTSPNTRAFYQSMISMVASALGMGIAHAAGVIIHWKTLSIFGMVLAILHICLPYISVESPQWLASRGRFDECQKAFRKLHGTKRSSENELRLLIKMETKKQILATETKLNNGFNKLMDALKKRYFWGLILTNCFAYTYFAFAGKVIFTNLATVILEEMTGNSDVLLYTLLVDGFVLLGTCVSGVLIKKMSVRVLLFTSGVTANLLLLVLSVCLYFKNDEKYFQWINVTLLAFYFIMANAGPYPVLDILLGELFPLEIKMYCFMLTTPILIGTIFGSILVMPMLVTAVGYHGLFFINAMVVFVCLGYFWLRLPETKGKTLQEIEVYFKTKNFDVENVINEQNKSLI
ncbi:facilitated trehalose transporter Tret1-like [Bicyclus anynana]|uniref:Facilitated trehalose transporter Tret1-like n=1 Tax=Bicyclus anynana TaxID=110368 RepID=A0A6J1NB15_BICAN|nr:facilitated trehalose transporter Tret1-like [Bicyclus anynana]